MRKRLLAAATTAALALGSTAANAAALVTTPTTLTPPASGFFGNFITNPGSAPFNFSDSFTFTIGGGANALTDSQIGTFLLGSSQNISFMTTAGCPGCGIWVDGTQTTPPANPALRFVQTQGDPLPETFALNPVVLAATTHTIFVNGSLIGPTGSYSGTINVQTAPVPEPATWAMMLVGFAGVGMVLRRRRRPMLAQIA